MLFNFKHVHEKGFSLIELMVVLLLTSTISLAVIKTTTPVIAQEKQLTESVYQSQGLSFIEQHLQSLNEKIKGAKLAANHLSLETLLYSYQSTSITMQEGEFIRPYSLHGGSGIAIKLWSDDQFYDCAGVSVDARKFVVNLIHIRLLTNGKQSLYCTSFAKNTYTVKLLDDIQHASFVSLQDEFYLLRLSLGQDHAHQHRLFPISSL